MVAPAARHCRGRSSDIVTPIDVSSAGRSTDIVTPIDVSSAGRSTDIVGARTSSHQSMWAVLDAVVGARTSSLRAAEALSIPEQRGATRPRASSCLGHAAALRVSEAVASSSSSAAQWPGRGGFVEKPLARGGALLWNVTWRDAT